MQKPSNPKGTRDFLPAVMQRRKYILDTIEGIFVKYGFQPLETPALEKLETLSGKYGEEGDKLLFRVLDQGNFTSKVDESDWDAKNVKSLASQIASKGLRYDLTVPLARAIVQNQNELSFPFRRYQMQAVWRGDRPQKGRYREFLQCDADVVGSRSLLNEVDLICIYHEVFLALGFEEYDLRINHRKLLEAIAENVGASEQFRSLTIAIDKFDKIGLEGVEKELHNLGLNTEQIEELGPFLHSRPLNIESLEQLENMLGDSEVGKSAISDLKNIVESLQNIGWKGNITLDGTLARGLDYYTGCIFEAGIPDSGIGSVSGGGRYDDLTGLFGLKDMPGVGISFGIDRLYDIMLERALFGAVANSKTNMMFCHFDEETRAFSQKLAHELRLNGLNIEVYPDMKKLKKQLDYANNRKIEYVVVMGSNEMESGVVELKNMFNGEKESCKIIELAQRLKK
jgi:histidyl-tRNA synthetase